MNLTTIFSMLLLFGCLTLNSTTAFTATTDQFAGSWRGDGTFTAVGETNSGSISLDLSVEGNGLVGTMSRYGEPAEVIQGSVVNGIFIFPVPNSEPDNPDCVNFNVTAEASLDEAAPTMSLSATGTFCGTGGGKPGTYTASLRKRIISSSVLLLLNSMLLK